MHNHQFQKPKLRQTFLSFCSHISILFFIFLPFTSTLEAQELEEKTFLQIRLQDKSKFTGELLSESKDSMILRNEQDEIVRLHRSSIKYSYKILSGKMEEGAYWADIVNHDKGYFTPHGFGLKKGEVYYENGMLGWNELNAGISDYFSLRVGFETFSLANKLLDEDDYTYNPLVFISSKFAIPIKKKWNLSITTAIANVPGTDGTFRNGFIFCSNTFGDKNKNATIGLGTQLFGIGGTFNSSYLTFSFSIRAGAILSITSENWFIPVLDRYGDDEVEYIGLMNNLGIKLMGKKATWSISIMRLGELNGNSDLVIPLPIFGVALPLSKTWKS